VPAAPLSSSLPTGEWDLATTNARFREAVRADRRRTLLRSGAPFLIFTGFLLVLARYALAGPFSLLSYWVIGLLIFAAVMGASLVYLLRLQSESLRRSLGARLVLTSERLRVVREAGADGECEVALQPDRVFVSPPGLNAPLLLRGGAFRPRAYVRLEPGNAPPTSFPVPDDAARAVHRAMTARAAFGIGYDQGRNPLTRVWIRYDTTAPPGTATGLLTRLEPKAIWSPEPTAHIILNRGRTPINAPTR